jgi:serine/threonine-protein kinase
VTLAIYGQRAPAEAMPRARASADRAVALAPSLAEALTARACVRAMYDWDWTGAEEDFRSAIQSDPQSPTARRWYQ